MNEQEIEKEYKINVKELSEILAPKQIQKLIKILSYLHMDRERIKKQREEWKKKYEELQCKNQ